MFKIISTKKFHKLLADQKLLKQLQKKEEIIYHCGYKSCNFHTTDPKGLKIHRARMHRHK